MRPDRWLDGWRLPLRLARRDVARSRARSILVLVMIALPVLAVTAADVVFQTSNVNSVESLDRRLGTADARVSVQKGIGPVIQAFDPDVNSASAAEGTARATPTLDDVRRMVGGEGAPALERRDGGIALTTSKGVGDAEATEIDLTDPLAKGLFDLTSGRLPRAVDEVVVNRALADRGFAVGDDLEVVGTVAGATDGVGTTLTIVGIAESTTVRDYPVVVGPLGSLGLSGDGQRTWLLGGGPVSWDQVRALNAVGVTVLSRAVLTDPPPDSELPPELSGFGGDNQLLAVIVLVVVMALLEVVLLAGPAFAVSARRQSLSLALMAATGGTPGQSRRVVLAGGLVLGGVAAAVGVLFGIVTGWALLPLVQRWSSSWFGPFEVPWLHLVGIAGFGLLSALLAAVVPAWIASRQDVVAILAGRRGDQAPGRRSPILGLVLLGLGIAGAAYGARSAGSGEYFIAGSAIVAVLGMILLVPVVVVTLARVSGRLPLTMRYAVRDAARQRTRTVPAVAAVAATVAGVVALGIATSSDNAQNEATYMPSLPMGAGSITAYDLDGSGWTRLAQAARRELPGADVVPLTGVVEGTGVNQPDASSYFLQFSAPGDRTPLLSQYSSSLGSSVLVDDAELPPVIQGVSEADRSRAAAMLARGGAVVFTDRAVDTGEVRIRVQQLSGDRPHRMAPVTVPAAFVQLTSGSPMVAAVIAPTIVEQARVVTTTVSLVVRGVAISPQQETDLGEAVRGLSQYSSFYVERGYQAYDTTRIMQLILGALGAVLMLGGTLTATFLALSDARPDLATLSAVGASPRTRRRVAASYALVVGLVGALLGAAVGFIPGIAITYPLTGNGYAPMGSDVASHYLDVPWLLIGSLVVALPLLTALIVGLTARSRLPLVSRLD